MQILIPTADNCTLEPIYYEISEIADIKRFSSIFDMENYRDFYDVEIMRKRSTKSLTS